MDILGTIQSALGGDEKGGNSGIQSTIMDLIGSQSGGLKGLVSNFTEGGLGDQVKSWVGTGDNLPVSSDQIQKVIGNDKVQKMASNLGLDTNDLSSQIAKYLPMVIDKLTPDGNVPADGIVDKGLGLLKNLFDNK